MERKSAVQWLSLEGKSHGACFLPDAEITAPLFPLIYVEPTSSLYVNRFGPNRANSIVKS